jgi:DNA-binding transcriptional MerR regulator
MDGMRISQLAARSGVPVSTLRYYEGEGLLPATRAGNGYRVYGEDALDRLAFINQAKSLSLQLAEIRELVTARDAEPCRTIRTRYRPMLDQHAEQVGSRINQLRALQSAITAARRHLNELPERETQCDAECFVPDRSADPAAAQSPKAVITIDAGETIACSLDGADYAARAIEWRSLIADAPCATTDDGLRFQLPTDRLETATALAVAEQRCCPFFRIGFELDGPRFAITVSAPPEAASMLAELFGTDST